MSLIKAIIIDDEKQAIEALKILTQLYCPELTIVASSTDMEEGVDLIKSIQPDLLFLDIGIGDEFGFDLFTRFKQITFQTIFITGHSEFAHQAFRVNALDYLLKPIIPDQLVAAVNKLKHYIDRNQLNKASNTGHKFRQIAIPSLEGITLLEVHLITHIMGHGNYSTFYMQDATKLVASKNLKHFESILPETIFFRSHQSFLVNKSYIKKILTKDGSSIELKDGTRILLARKRKESLLKELKNQFGL